MIGIARFAISGLLLVIVAARFFAQPSGASDHPARVQLNEADAASRIIQRVAPIYPAQARAGHVEGTVVLAAIIAKDGSIVQLQAVSGHPPLVLSALEALKKWRYRPAVVTGNPVEVATTITVDFKLHDSSASQSANRSTSAPATIVDSDAASPETIRLKIGRIIRAETVSEAGDRIEYTIGEALYEIPKSLVQEVVHSPNTPPRNSGAPSNGISSTVIAHSLSKAPLPFGEDSKNWYLFESTRELREECRNGQFAVRLHSEFQSRSNFPVSEAEAKNTCAMLAVDLGLDYERLVDRGVELQRILCTAGGGTVPPDSSPDSAIRVYQEEMHRILVEFGKRTDRVLNEHGQYLKGMRIMIDLYRMAGTCGHGL